EQVQSALKRFADRIELVYMKERTLAELLAAVKAIPTQSLIFYTRYTPADAVGTRVGEIALQILKGTPPEDIPIDTVPTTPIFDWRQVKRWGIDPTKLPPGSRILFRTPSVWETYRSYIIGTI